MYRDVHFEHTPSHVREPISLPSWAVITTITLVDAHGPVQLQNVLHRYIDCNNDIVLHFHKPNMINWSQI
jgi:hypothetical protein